MTHKTLQLSNWDLAQVDVFEVDQNEPGFYMALN
jgi:hypothetical protein